MIVSNLRTLQRMDEKGYIDKHPDMGKPVEIGGVVIRAHYVKDGIPRFRYNGKQYSLKRLSGCEYPFVVEHED